MAPSIFTPAAVPGLAEVASSSFGEM